MAEHGKLRELAKAATPGPWLVEPGEQATTRVLAPQRYDDEEVTELVWRRDGDYIVAACNAMPALLDEIEAARAEVERLKARLGRNRTDTPENKGDSPDGPLPFGAAASRLNTGKSTPSSTAQAQPAGACS